VSKIGALPSALIAPITRRKHLKIKGLLMHQSGAVRCLFWTGKPLVEMGRVWERVARKLVL